MVYDRAYRSDGAIVPVWDVVPVVSLIVSVGKPMTVTKSVFDFSDIVKAEIPGVRTGVAATGELGRARWIAITLTPGQVGL